MKPSPIASPPASPFAFAGLILVAPLFFIAAAVAQSGFTGDPNYVAAEPMQRLALISQWVGQDQVNEALAAPEIRREAMAFLDASAATAIETFRGTQSGFGDTSFGSDDLDPSNEGQWSDGVGDAAGIPRRQIEARIRRNQAGNTSELMTEFQARVNANNQLQFLGRRGQVLQNIALPNDLLDGVARKALDANPAYLNGTPRERMNVLQYLRSQNVWSPNMQQESVRVYESLVQSETINLSSLDAVTGQMILLREVRREGMVPSSYSEPLEERLVGQFLSLHPRTARGSASDQLKMLRILAMEHQLVGGRARAKLEQPVLLQALRSDPAFMSADAATKRSIIRGMKQRGEINFYTVSKIEAEFGLRGGDGGW